MLQINVFFLLGEHSMKSMTILFSIMLNACIKERRVVFVVVLSRFLIVIRVFTNI